MTKTACEAGADALLAVTPYYNKCTQAGLVAYFEAVAAASDRPVILYNVPGRTGVTIEPATAALLAKNPRIVGLKDAGESISKTAATIARCGDALTVYSGADEKTLPVLSLGGQGVISVLSNVAPGRMKRLCTKFFEGKNAEAAALQAALHPLMEALFCEVNPIPVKAALAEMGLIENILRSPLTPLSECYIEPLQAALASVCARPLSV